MIMIKYIASLVLIATLLTSCYDTEIYFEDQFIPVVQGYLDNNEDSVNIKVTEMLSFGDDSTGGQGITGLNILLENREANEFYYLTESDSIGEYYYPEGIEITASDSFHLSFEHNGELISAATVVPELPPLVNISTDTIYVEKVATIFEFKEIVWPAAINISWEYQNNEYFYFVVENIEYSPVSIIPSDMVNPFFGGRFKTVSVPVNGTEYQILPESLTEFGSYRVTMYSVNEEYARLYDTMNQDASELNEPYSNIENGLGILTAFSSREVYFEVMQKIN